MNLPKRTINLKTAKAQYDVDRKTIYNDIFRKKIRRYGRRRKVLLDLDEFLKRYVGDMASDLTA